MICFVQLENWLKQKFHWFDIWWERIYTDWEHSLQTAQRFDDLSKMRNITSILSGHPHFALLLSAFVANLKIDALFLESFCDKNLAVRKVLAFFTLYNTSMRKIGDTEILDVLTVQTLAGPSDVLSITSQCNDGTANLCPPFAATYKSCNAKF